MSGSETQKTVKQPKSLSFSLKYLFGVGDAGFKLMSNIETFYFTFFLTNIAAFSTGIVATISSVLSIVDACLSWTYGGILNGSKAMKWGRYRSWLIVVPWIVPFIYAFQFIKVSDNVALSAVIITASALISHIFWNFSYVANVTLVNVVGKTPEDKATLSSSRATWNSAGGILFSYMGLPFANLLAGFVGESNKLAAAAFCLGLLFVIGFYAHFRMTDGYEEIEDNSTKKAAKNKTTVKDMFAALFKNPMLMILIVADFAKWCMNFVVSGSAIYYFKYTANKPGLMAVYILISSIAAVIGAYVFRYMASKFSSRSSMIFAYIMSAASMILVYFCYNNVTLVIALMSVALFFYGVALAATPALYADTVVYATWKSGKDASGWIMGLQNLPIKIGVFLRGIIIPAALAAIGFSKDMDPKTMSEAARQGMTIAFGLIPGIFCAVGALLLIFGFKLTKEKVLMYQAEINSRG